MKRIRTYLAGRINSFRYAFNGIWILFKTERNAKIHLLAVLIITALGFYLGLSAIEWCFITLCMGVVLAAEAINTAIESLVDLISPDEHPLAGKAKDVAAGAVLLLVIFCGIVWGIIYLPKILTLLG